MEWVRLLATIQERIPHALVDPTHVLKRSVENK